MPSPPCPYGHRVSMKHPETTTSTAGRGGRRRGAEASSGTAPSRCRKGQAVAAVPSLPLGLRPGAGHSRPASPRLASPLAAPSRRLRHAPRFPEQPARLHLRAVAAERRPHAHHEVSAGREVRRAPAAWARSGGVGGGPARAGASLGHRLARFSLLRGCSGGGSRGGLGCRCCF